MIKGFGAVCLLILGNAHMTLSALNDRRGKPMSRSLEQMVVPVLGDAWERIPDFPPEESDNPVGEAAAAMVGDDLVITGGFETGWRSGAEATYTFNIKDHFEGKPVEWARKDDNPIKPFVSHSAHAVKGGLMYHCGGYLGKDPGPHIADCYVFDKDAEPENQWTSIRPLPDGRGGGAMVYVEEMDSLVFSLGARRLYDSNDTFTFDTYTQTIDYEDTWMLDLSDENADWVSLAPIPYKANHVSAVTAKDCSGNLHYYFLSGQLEEREQDGNLDDVYEYFPETNEWEQRAPIPVPTGHVTSSTIAYGCGFLIVGGSVDGHDATRKMKTDDIYYYDIPSDQWTKIGDYVKKSKTPVCTVYSNKLYCTSGYLREGYRTDISFVSVPVPLWDDYFVLTKVKSGDFCPGATLLVRLKVAGETPAGVPVTLKNSELGIDLAGVTNKHGKAKFAVSVANPGLSGKYLIEGCVKDAGGAEYCHKREVELSCSI